MATTYTKTFTSDLSGATGSPSLALRSASGQQWYFGAAADGAHIQGGTDGEDKFFISNTGTASLSGNLTASGGFNGTVGATTPSTGAFTTITGSGLASIADTIRTTGSATSPASGQGIEMLYVSAQTRGVVRAYDRSGSAALQLDINDTGGLVKISNGVAQVSSTGLAVTGALSSTTASTLCSTSGTLTVGSNTAVTGGIIVNTLGTTGNMPYLNFKVAGTQYGLVALTGTLLGTTATDLGIFAETGKTLNLWANGQTTIGAQVNSTGLAVTGALSATGTTTIGANNTGSGLALLQLFGGSSANGGGSVYFGTNGTAYSSIGQASGILGGTSTDFVIYANNGSQNIKFYAGGSGNVGTFSSTGLAVTGGITQSGTGNGANTFTNTSASGYSSLRAINNAASECEFGIRGSTYSSYGALVASDGYIYRNGNFTLMADGSGVIKFAAGGATERARIDSGGTLVLQGNTWVPNVNNGVFWNYTGTQQEGIYYDGTAVVIRRANNDNAFRLSTSGLSVSGNLSVGGALSKGSGSFRIEHPLPSKSATHQLVHSFIEGPQADLIYRGKVVLIDGKASVNIDVAATMTEGTFEVLCRDVQCFTTNESGWTAVRGKVTGNILTIEAKDSDCTDEISWMVIGERKDPHMMETDWTDENGKVIVEPLKPVTQPIE